MSMLAWLRQPEKRAQLPGLVLLGVASVWAVCRTARSLGMLFGESHDLDTYYSLWFLLRHREYADVALSQALYLPHTWVVLTPLFLLGWPVARAVMLLLNVASVLYLWWRLSDLATLHGIRRWLFLVFFWGWLPTGLVIGLGNLALVCVAAVLAAYPFKSANNGLFLTLSGMKQSLIFPLYFQLLIKRPKALLVPFAVFALCGIATLAWARLGLAEGLRMAKGSMDMASAWTLYDFTCLRRLLAPLVKDNLLLTTVMWVIWFALFGVTARFIKDPLAQVAALLLLSLLPVYHQKYDLVAAAPVLAIFLRRCRLTWPTLMTASLATDFGASFSRFLPAGPLRSIAQTSEQAYYPALILCLLGALLYLETRRREARVDDG